MPALLTPVPSFKEQGYVEGKNCYYIPFDMNDINIDRIKKIPEYEGFIKPDNWNNVLVESKSTYETDLNKRFLVRATGEFERLQKIDATLGYTPKEGEEWIVDGERLEILEGNNLYNAKLVERIKEVKKK